MCRALIKILCLLWALLLAEVASAQRVMPIVKMYGDFGDAYTKGRIIVYDPDSLMPDTFDMYAKFRGASSKYYEKKNYLCKKNSFNAFQNLLLRKNLKITLKIKIIYN